MHLSSIKQLPKPTKPIKTSSPKHHQYHQLLPQISNQLKNSTQPYLISPLIQTSHHLQHLQNLLPLYQSLQTHYPNQKLPLLHRKMTPEHKHQLIQKFTQHQIHILLSTTVVDLPVNVPNPTFMMIYDP
ncbi:helicase-related protein, partial [Staphylococcus epidermidis]|uniref:helicase-related protein n=1 Tax=Staphylococcus epidermidis TaxID=1282 RepID=UPI0028CB8108